MHGSRWYHQSQVKNGILFIDGGIETFSDRAPFFDSNVSQTNPNPLSDAYLEGSSTHEAVTDVNLLCDRGLSTTT